MVDYILSLSTWAGLLLSMLLTGAAGLVVYYGSYRAVASYHSKAILEPISSLFRVLGMLVSLMLSLAFAEVVVDINTIESAIERETAAIADIYHDLGFYGTGEALAIRPLLLVYAEAVVVDDWPALADDRLGEGAGQVRRQIAKNVLSLEPVNPVQEKLWHRILADVDRISDYRMLRLDNALEKPPIYLYVIMVGFLITTACFGAYPPQAPVVSLLTLYCLFVGFVLYLILALSDPFQGGLAVDTAAFDYLIEKIKADSG